MPIKSLTIYCSSSEELTQKYYDLAEKIGIFLAKKSIRIIYGGGKIGLMGKISQSSTNMGGKVIVPTQEFINKLVAARLAADVMGVPTVIIARTDSNAAKLITSDVDKRDSKFVMSDKGKSPEGFHYINNGINLAIDRGLSYSPYSDVLWCETSKPNIKEATLFAEGVHKKHPNK